MKYINLILNYFDYINENEKNLIFESDSPSSLNNHETEYSLFKFIVQGDKYFN